MSRWIPNLDKMTLEQLIGLREHCRNVMDDPRAEPPVSIRQQFFIDALIERKQGAKAS